jgi:hypothetical protein
MGCSRLPSIGINLNDLEVWRDFAGEVQCYASDDAWLGSGARGHSYFIELAVNPISGARNPEARHLWDLFSQTLPI